MLVRPALRDVSAQRYWRRRANRRVRKARVTRSVLRWAALALIHVLWIGVVTAAGFRVWRGVTTTSEFALEQLEVAGARRTSSDALRARLAPYLGRNLLELDLQELARAAAHDPWALEVSAKRMLPHTVRLTVRERTPSTIALIGGVAHVVDATGFVLGPCGPTLPDDLPVLVGLGGLEEPELVAALERGARAVEALRGEFGRWVDEISEVDLSRPDRITVRTTNGAAPILLDPAHVMRNVSDWLTLARDIEGRVGPLDYVDLRWSDRITVMPE